MGSQFSILGMIQQGYYATYPLLFISVVCLAIIFERVWALMGISGRAAKLADTLVPALRQGKFNEALAATQARANAAERIYHTLVTAAQTLDRDHLVELDEERRFQETIELNRYVWVLATSGASAPFIGLFGTVVGILVAFQSMAIMGTGGFSVVAAGISEALHLDRTRTRGRDRRGYLLQLLFGEDSEHQRASADQWRSRDRRGSSRETGRWPLVDPKVAVVSSRTSISRR